MSNEPKVSPIKSNDHKPKPNFTNEALGTFKDSKSGEWYVAVVKFDPETGVTGEFSSMPAGGTSKDFGIELFKLEAFKRGIAG